MIHSGSILFKKNIKREGKRLKYELMCLFCGEQLSASIYLTIPLSVCISVCTTGAHAGHEAMEGGLHFTKMFPYAYMERLIKTTMDL